MSVQRDPLDVEVSGFTFLANTLKHLSSKLRLTAHNCPAKRIA